MTMAAAAAAQGESARNESGRGKGAAVATVVVNNIICIGLLSDCSFVVRTSVTLQQTNETKKKEKKRNANNV